MARYRGSRSKLSRKVGTTLDGQFHNEQKKGFAKRPYAPGVHGRARRKLTEYAIQLREKQKVKYTYGVLEKQFRRYFKEAVRRKGVTGTLLLQILETRLDNLVYRAGFAKTRRQARQFVAHGHILVNGKRLNIPSARLKAGDIVSIHDKKKAMYELIQEGFDPIIPEWLESDLKQFAFKFVSIPEREDIDPEFQENLIIEYYSR